MARTIITGANRGIGLELVRQMTGRGDEVIAVCRTASPELRETGAVIHEGVDVTDAAAVTSFAESLAEGSIDVLLNNAGILRSDRLGALDYDALRLQFEVNALGPLRFTETLLPTLRDGGKIGIVTSAMGSIGDNASGGSYGYRMSKAAANMAGVSLARDLRHRGISVILLHPGYVKTDMTGGSGNVTPAEAARGLIERLDALTPELSGTFWHAEGRQLPW